MKLEDIVCDLVHAEELNKLGINNEPRKIHESIFVYAKYDNNGSYEVSTVGTSFEWGAINKIRAYTVAELGEMLPDKIMLLDHGAINNNAWLEYDKDTDCERHNCYISYFKGDPNNSTEAQGYWFHDKKEANARAELLIWLIENNHINVEDLNND